MGMAGWVRLGGGMIRSLPAVAGCELDLDAQGRPIAVAFERTDEGKDADGRFELYQDLADAMTRDGALDELD
jgi:hypothetical protein